MSSWIVTPIKRPAARAHLIVVPHAGASANFFHKWVHLVPDDVELHLVEMPGRGRRSRERFPTHWHEVVDALAAEIVPLTERPYAVFGHSLGAHLAYRALARLAPSDRRSLLHFFPSAAKSPAVVTAQGFFPDQRAMGDDRELVEELRSFGGVDALVLDNAEFLQLFLRVLRADYALCRTLADATVHPGLDCNMTALAGSMDQFASLDLVAGWQSVCERVFELKSFAGGHFYFDTPAAPLPALLGEIVHWELAAT